MNVTLSPPPAFVDFSGVQSYLFQMSEQLNVNFSDITPLKFWEATSRAATASDNGNEDKALLSSYNAIKSLIIKTADDVIVDSEAFTLKLGEKYIAKSQFGDYFADATVDIEGTAYGITQLYNYTATVESDLADYQVESANYIKTGLLYYDGATPVYGVGVGVLGERVTVNGNEVLNRSNLLATFTASEIAFWKNNTKLAYITATDINFPSAVITGGSININNKCTVSRLGKLTAEGADIDGKITSTSGDIGGFELSSTGLQKVTTTSTGSNTANRDTIELFSNGTIQTKREALNQGSVTTTKYTKINGNGIEVFTDETVNSIVFMNVLVGGRRYSLYIDVANLAVKVM